jgi:hypothetical protein
MEETDDRRPGGDDRNPGGGDRNPGGDDRNQADERSQHRSAQVLLGNH